MYSFAERLRAVKLYIQYRQNAVATVHELGYPSRPALRAWYKEFKKTGIILHDSSPTYSKAQQDRAIAHYMEVSRSFAETCRVLGYPARPTLRLWVNDRYPGEKEGRKKFEGVIEYTKEQKEAAVADMCNREAGVTVTTIAKKHGTTRTSLYNWKDELLGKEKPKAMKRPIKPPSKPAQVPLPDDKDALEKQLSELKEQIYFQRIERANLFPTNGNRYIRKDS